MPQYEVIKTDPQSIREWDNPRGGKVYYIKAALKDKDTGQIHPKAVSIGKKSPDALQVGMTVYGTIEKTAMDEDKWHAEQNPNFSSGGNSVGGGGLGVRGERQFKADPERQASIEAQFAIKTAIEYLNHAAGDISLSDVEAVATDLFDMIERVKSGGSQGTAKATNEVQNPDPATSSAPPRDWSKVGKGSTTEPLPDWPGQEEVDLSEIPF